LPDWTIGQLRARRVSDATAEQFAELVRRARADTDCHSAREFLAALSRRELRVLAEVHGLNAPIRLATLDAARAMRLLNPFAIAPGQLPAMVFPPPSAPAAVHRAWGEATAGQSDLELLDSMAPFLAQSAAGNTRYDVTGKPIACIAPGEPDYFDIYAETGFSYADQVTFLMEALRACWGFLGPAAFRRRKAFLLHYRCALAGATVDARTTPRHGKTR
ncbi:MAG: hypothetical protein HQL66_13940, partial [Magnetococcales bacterium]|nr:hypothetical protein [Magnetococcales bacterium]